MALSAVGSTNTPPAYLRDFCHPTSHFHCYCYSEIFAIPPLTSTATATPRSLPSHLSLPLLLLLRDLCHPTSHFHCYCYPEIFANPPPTSPATATPRSLPSHL